MSKVERIRVVDSHTAGEPTRVVLEGGPDLGHGSAAERLEVLRRDHDWLRRAVVTEPRGHDAMVGALLCEPTAPGSVGQVIFFNNVGYLGMCGHGTIGVVATLAWLERIAPGAHRIESPVGDVEFTLADDGTVQVSNVPSYRLVKDVELKTRSHGVVHGDVAWGGNWFFLVSEHGQRLELDNRERLTDLCVDIRESLARAGIRGRGGEEIDHIELFGAAQGSAADSRNFVLCPGREYDRSPCGTGVSAKLACLWADGLLEPGQVWRQQSVIGSVMSASVAIVGDTVVPTIAAKAWVTGESTLVIQSADPFGYGIDGR